MASIVFIDDAGDAKVFKLESELIVGDKIVIDNLFWCCEKCGKATFKLEILKGTGFNLCEECLIKGL